MTLLARLRAICLLLLLVTPWPALAAPQGWNALLEPAQLANILMMTADVRVLHVTGNYAAGHIPGAIEAPYDGFRGPSSNPGALPPLDQLSTLVRRFGITPQTPVVIVHAGVNASDFGAAARVYWTLKSLGVKDLALINGGFAGWAAANLPVSTESSMVAASDFTPQWSDEWRVNTHDVEQLVANKSARLIDARTPDFYEGMQATSGRPGTIKGAGNLSFTNFFEGSRVKGPTQVKEILTSQAQAAAPMTVSFCNTGHLAAINWFIMSELQKVPNTRLYAESMTEWSMADRPMDNQPNRLRYYWLLTTSWFIGLLGY